jgi:Ca-activated chloride channel family protein
MISSKKYKQQLFTVLFLGVMMFLAVDVTAQTPKKTRILFVLDGSQSMYARWENGQKMQVATRLLGEMVDSLKSIENVEVALRAFGHTYRVVQGDRSCTDTKLEVPFGQKNHDRIISRLRDIRPMGTTLIAYSLEQAANDFPTCTDCRNIIVLITDGIEECDGDPCAVSLALQRKGIILKPFVIGLGLDPSIMDAFKCIGNFYDARNESTFKQVLNIVISQALNNTTAQVNLLDIYNEPTETNVAMTFYDAFSGVPRYNFVHTIDSRGNPDTIPIDPLGKYNLVVHTTPSVEKKNIELTAGTHNKIAVDAAQGSLILQMNGFNEYQKLQAIVRKKGEMNTLYAHAFDEEKKYLVGKYDLEIMTLPRIMLPDVNIAQSNVTKIMIPQPGVASIGTGVKGYGSIFVEKADELELVTTLNTSAARESIVLQPGSYRLVFRPVNAKQSIYTKEISFTITSGQTTQVKF